MEKIALSLIYNVFVTKKNFPRNEHQKNFFDSQVSCRPGRVTANQHILSLALIKIFAVNEYD